VAAEDLPFELAFMRGLNREKLGDSEGAAHFYRSALSSSPGRYFVMYPLGRVLFRVGDFEEGTNWFEAARVVSRGGTGD
jgi:Tfp pilus assembly protein PilF